MADAHRDQRSADAAAEARSASALSLDETLARTSWPAAERFADDGPNPEQVFQSTEIREMISEIWTSFTAFAVVCTVHSPGIAGRKQRLKARPDSR